MIVDAVSRSDHYPAGQTSVIPQTIQGLLAEGGFESRVIYPGLPRTWDPLMVSGTHTIPISLGILMGVVWE